MIRFLNNLQHKEKKISNFRIYIVEQSNDGRKFNRGKLLNIGFDLAHIHRKGKTTSTGNTSTGKNGNGNNMGAKHNVFIFHDVDLLPNPQLNEAYLKFPTVPHHIAWCWDRYSNNPKYFRRIVSFSLLD